VSTYNGPERRQRTRIGVRLAIGWMIAVSVVVIYTAQQNRERTQEGRNAHAALCVFKGSVARAVQQTEDFLQHNPNGLPGIPASVLRQSLTQQETTLRALDVLRCD